ncbi:MAG TPA: hypothetical protein PK413_04230, partial [Thermoanaerobaculia bacterium]|nr:hypothetical protein [Thermoanaerobaculia bacterium]
MTLIAPVARTAEPLLGEFRTGPERPGRGLELRFQGELTNLEELARRLNRPALEGDPVPLLTELYRRLGAGFVADLRGSFA